MNVWDGPLLEEECVGSTSGAGYKVPSKVENAPSASSESEVEGQ